MQLMTFNSLLMFDIVFVFFLFLVGVTCLVYYLPPANRMSPKSTVSGKNSDIEDSHHYHHQQLGSNQRLEGDEDDEATIQYYRHINRHHRCPHHHHHYHHQHEQQLHHPDNFMNNNRYMPVMTSSPGSGGGGGGSSSGGSSRSYIPQPSPEDEEQGNMEILPVQERPVIKSLKSSRHLYHNILNSAFEHEDDSYDECNMIATNVEILTSPTNSMGIISTSLPASPSRNNSRVENGNSGETVINIENPTTTTTAAKLNGVARNNPFHLHRPECQSARHVVGICQYHMQQHLKSHHEQHQLQRLYQQQQLLQQFTNQQQISSPPPPTTPSSIAPQSQEFNSSAEDKKVQYIVVDTTTDRSKKRLNKYCHVKAENCDIKKCAGPVDEV